MLGDDDGNRAPQQIQASGPRRQPSPLRANLYALDRVGLSVVRVA